MDPLVKEAQAAEAKFKAGAQERERLEYQLQESEIVRTELASLKEDANVYKIRGSVLLPEDKSQALSTVEKRIEFIKNEISKSMQQIKIARETYEKAMAQLQEKSTAAAAAAAEQKSLA